MKSIIKGVLHTMKDMDKQMEGKNKAKKAAGKILAAFVVMMLMLSILSRIADSLTIPTVTVNSPGSGYLEFTVEGSGNLVAETEEYLDIPEGIRIQKVEVLKGQTVAKGDALAHYDLKYLQKHLETLKNELEENKRAYETEVLVQKQEVNGVEEAQKNVKTASKKKETAQNELKAAKEKYNKKIVKIEENLTKQQKEEYDEVLAKLDETKDGYNTTEKKYEELKLEAQDTLEELKQAKESEIKSLNEDLSDTQFALDELVGDYNNVIQALKNYQESAKVYNVETMQKNLAQLMIAYFGEAEYTKMIENGIESDNEKFVSILTASSQYETSLINHNTENQAKYYKVLLDEVTDKYEVDETTKYTYETKIERLKESISDSSSNHDKKIAKQQAKIIELGEETEEELKKAQESIDKQQKEYDEILSKVYEDEDSMESATDAYTQANEAYEEASSALEEAVEALDTAQNNSSYQEKIDAYKLESLEDAVKEKQVEYEALKQVYEADGALVATCDGIIQSLDLTDQLVTTGTEKVSIAPKTCYFKGSFSEDDSEHVSVGDELTCKLSNKEEELNIQITSIQYDSVENNYMFTASLPEGEFIPGTNGTYSLTKTSEKYECCVPIEAIRSDMNGTYYVLVVGDKSSILGNEKAAVRINVTVKKKDYKTAVIEGALSEDDMIITGSSNVISAGDRVRVE